MKKSYIFILVLAAMGIEGVLLYHPTAKNNTASAAGSVNTPTGNSTSTLASASTIPQTTSSNTTATSSSSSTNKTSSGLKDGTFKGSSSSTPFGNVQISIKVSSGKITDVTFLSMPNSDRHSSQISSYASSQLKSQTLSAQSANIDGVSGATYTSNGYMYSLQAAIDSAKSA